jgi:hypothetical protein
LFRSTRNQCGNISPIFAIVLLYCILQRAVFICCPFALACGRLALGVQDIVPPKCAGLASAIPLLLEGLRENTSLVQVIISSYTSESFPPVYASTCRYVGGRMQEMQFLGYRNRVLPLVRAPAETAPPLGLWSRGLAKVATLPDVLFYVLRAKPKLVPSADTDDDTSKKRKRGDNE